MGDTNELKNKNLNVIFGKALKNIEKERKIKPVKKAIKKWITRRVESHLHVVEIGKTARLSELVTVFHLLFLIFTLIYCEIHGLISWKSFMVINLRCQIVQHNLRCQIVQH